MKKLSLVVILLLSILLPEIAMAQNKTTRKIYLWDVTLSMKGYKNGEFHTQDKTLNIYDKVVEWLLKDINSVNNPSTEIIVLPFQEKILDTIRVNEVSNETKKYLAEKIKGFYNDEVTRTNISVPLTEAYNKYAKHNRYNDFVILTDGGQNTAGGNEALNRALDRFRKTDSISPESFLYYVLLTDKAKLDTDIAPGKNIMIIDPSQSTRDKLTISIPNIISYKLDENKSELEISLNAERIIPEGVKMRIFAESLEYNIYIDEVVNVVENKVKVSVNYDYESVKYQVPEVYNIPLYVELINDEELFSKYNVNIVPSKLQSSLSLINKPYKKLTIKLKK